jgi:hypothetical protein
LSNIDLEELERLAAQATPGPWKAENWSRVWHEPKQGVRRTVADCVRVTVKSPKRHRANARLIAAMHEALPELIAENRELRERVRELEIREVDYIEERDALLCTKYALERQRAWLAERLNFICHSDTDCVLGCPDIMNGNCRNVTRSQWIEAAKEAGE